MKKNAHLRAMLGITMVALAPVSTQAGGRFDLDESGEPAATVRLAQASNWSNAGFFPTFMAVGVTEARRAAAGNSSELMIGPDGTTDVTLTTLIDLTLKNNLDIRIEAYSPALGIEAINAREAIFDPLLRFTLSLFSTTNPTAAVLEGADILEVDRSNWDFGGQKLIPWGGTAGISWNNQREKTNSQFATLNPSYVSQLNFSIDQPLLRNFGKDVTRREIRIASNDHNVSQEQFRLQVMRSVATAIDAYWDLYGKIEQLEVRREALRLSEDLLRINRTRVEVGVMAPLEVATAEAEVARNEGILITAQADVENARDRVLTLINTPQLSALWSAKMQPVDAPKLDRREIDLKESYLTALEMRPDIRQQRLQMDNDLIRLDFARNQLKPGLNLNAGWGATGLGGTAIVNGGPGEEPEMVPGGYGDALDQLFSFDFANWRVGATFELPVFNQAAEANHATARLNQSRNEDRLEAVRQVIAVEVRRLARATTTSFESSEAAEATRRLQEKRLDAEQKKFEHGLSTNFEVATAQQDLTEARTSEVISITTYQRALSALDLAVGTILDEYGIELGE